MNKDRTPDIAGMGARVAVLVHNGYDAERMARFLNAEFEGCFYAMKHTLWVSYMENGREHRMILYW